jgi:hypothetical protein
MRKFIVFTTTVCLAFCCSQQSKEAKISSTENNFQHIRDSVFTSLYGGYGYDIIMDGEVKIHQPIIPVIEGTQGFASEAQAKKTAQLVITKIQNNEFPPQLTLKDLKDLEIIP